MIDNFVIYVLGPTASGKTSLAVELALKFNAEVVSADSMQIYKGMSIASAAPKDNETKGVPHHLVEFLEFTDEFTAADYVNLAREKINEIHQRGKNCIVAGGTGLYLTSLIDNICFSEHEDNSSIRAELEKNLEEKGPEFMLDMLRSFDPDSAEKLHPNNKRRIIRAIEVYRLTGKTATELNILSKSNKSPYNQVVIGINYKSREKLYERINKRVDLMLCSGLLEEAKSFFNLKLGSGAAQAIGHKELAPFFRGEISLEEATENLKRATRRYAKRQMTWFNKQENINWIYADQTDDIVKAASKIIETEIKKCEEANS